MQVDTSSTSDITSLLDFSKLDIVDYSLYECTHDYILFCTIDKSYRDNLNFALCKKCNCINSIYNYYNYDTSYINPKVMSLDDTTFTDYEKLSLDEFTNHITNFNYSRCLLKEDYLYMAQQLIYVLHQLHLHIYYSYIIESLQKIL